MRLLTMSRARPGWAHPKAALSLDFLGNRVWRAGSGVLALPSALATVRSSSHLLTDADGVVRSFGPNALASLPGVGAYVGAQAVSMLMASVAFTTPILWTKYGSPAIADNAALAPDGAMTAASFSGAAGGAYLLTQNLNVTAGQKYTLSVWMRGAVGGEKVRIDFKNQTSGGISGTLFTLTSGWKRYSVTLTADATAQRGFQFRVEAAMGNPDFTFFMWNAVVEIGGFASPDIVSPVDAQGVRLASDVRAIASGSEPFAGWTAAGLDAGFSVLATVKLSHVGDGVYRYIMSINDGTSGNRMEVSCTNADRLLLEVWSGGSKISGISPPELVSTGRLKIAGRVSSATKRLAATGLTAVTSSNAGMPSGMTRFGIGQRYDTDAFFNDTIERIEICRPLTDTEMDAWVAA